MKIESDEIKKREKVVLKIINKWLGEIEGLYIPEHLREKGNGTLLMRSVEQSAKSHGLGKLSLLCRSDNTAARRLFSKLNYHEEAELVNHFKYGEDMIVYSKFL